MWRSVYSMCYDDCEKEYDVETAHALGVWFTEDTGGKHSSAVCG